MVCVCYILMTTLMIGVSEVSGVIEMIEMIEVIEMIETSFELTLELGYLSIFLLHAFDSTDHLHRFVVQTLHMYIAHQTQPLVELRSS